MPTSMNIRQKFAVLLISVINLTSFCTIPFLASIFLPDRQHDGDFVKINGFSNIQGLIIFIISPIIGLYAPRISSKKSFIIGVIISRLATILYGFLFYLKDDFFFEAASFLFRLIESVAASSYFVIGCGLMFNSFPEIRGVIRGLFENSIEVFITISPTISNAKLPKNILFTEEKYWLPFFILGSIIIALVMINSKCLDEVHDEITNEKLYLKMFKIPMTFMLLCIVSTISLTTTCLYATLNEIFAFDDYSGRIDFTSNMLAEYSQIHFTVIFLIISLFWGFISLKIERIEKAIPFGLTFTGVTILALDQRISHISSSYFILFMVAILGMTIPIAQTPTFRCLNASAFENGFEDNLESKTFMVAAWSFMSTIGSLTMHLIYYFIEYTNDTKFTAVIITTIVNIIISIIFTIWLNLRVVKHSKL